ncbi:MAG: purine-nucleoside phosphorylase, partial [Gemmatimonadales bacterium]
MTGSATAATEAVLSRLGPRRPRVAIVLGSGLGFLADDVADPLRILYRDIPGFPEPGVAGHKGELVAGTLEGVPVIVQAGRFHLYEGHSPDIAALPARVFAGLGVKTLIVTNAAGGVRRTFRAGTLMLIADHINLMWRNPLTGRPEPGEDRFPLMHKPYDGELRAQARAVAAEAGIPLEEGVYAALLGPSYETPAEVRMLERLGVDAVGMSTVPD